MMMHEFVLSAEESAPRGSETHPRVSTLSTDSMGSGQSPASAGDSGYETMQQHLATFTLGDDPILPVNSSESDLSEEDSDIDDECFFDDTLTPSQITRPSWGEAAQNIPDIKNASQTVSTPIDIPVRTTSGPHVHSDPTGARCQPHGLVPSYEAVLGRCHASSQTEAKRNRLGLRLNVPPRARSKTIANEFELSPERDGSNSLPDVVPTRRDRSLSMPNVQLDVQRSMGMRLRRMSDVFHEEKQVYQMRRNSQSQASSMPSGFQYFTESLRRIVSGHFTHPD